MGGGWRAWVGEPGWWGELGILGGGGWGGGCWCLGTACYVCNYVWERGVMGLIMSVSLGVLFVMLCML